MAATVVIGFINLVIAAFWVTLIADSVQTWINRSLLGVNEIQLNKFTSIEEEQNSLEMVFAGIVVDFYWDKEGDYSSSDSGALFYASYGGSLYSYKINMHILVLDLDQFNLKVSINAIDLDKQIANWEYSKLEYEGEVIKILDTTDIVSNGESQPDMISNGNGFVLEWDCRQN